MGYAKAPARKARTSTEPPSGEQTRPEADATRATESTAVEAPVPATETPVVETLRVGRSATDTDGRNDLVILPNRVVPEGVNIRWSSFSIVDAFIVESRGLRFTKQDRLDRLKRRRAARAQ